MAKHETQPLRVALPFDAPDMMNYLAHSMEKARTVQKWEQPTHVHGVHVPLTTQAFQDVSFLLIAAIDHAHKVRQAKNADIGVGIAHGLLYVPCETSQMETPLLFETLLLVVSDKHGPTSWYQPGEANPEAVESFFPKTLGQLFDFIVKERKEEVPHMTLEMLNQLLPTVLGYIRPFPSTLGQFRMLH